MTKSKEEIEKFEKLFDKLTLKQKEIVNDYIYFRVAQAKQRTIKETVEWARDNNFFATYESIGNEKIETRCVDYEELLEKLKNDKK